MFAYLRLFAILSLLTVTCFVAVAGWYFLAVSEERLVKMAERTSISVSQSYINAVWRSYNKALVPLVEEGDVSKLRASQDVRRMAKDTIRYFKRVPLTRVNIYTAKGNLLMSSNIKEGRQLPKKTPSPNSKNAAKGLKSKLPSSAMLHNVVLRDGGSGNMVQTFIPIIGSDEKGHFVTEGMLEVINDVTDELSESSYVTYIIMAGTVFLFACFLGIMILVARKAEQIIAKQHEANLELSTAAATAQAESQEKSQFLANISHELRTPLNAVIGFSDILKNEVILPMDNETYTRYITDINSAGTHLLSLINDILDYSKAEAGKLEMEVAEINGTKLVRNCMRLVEPRAEAGNVKLVDGLPKEQFVMVNDGKKFKQILLNLLSNAVKFTPDGGQVMISAWANLADDTISFEIQDSGIGIAPKDISRAMSVFGQVDNSLQRRYEGTGLGLPLTKKFVELMGGKFEIVSEVGKGTTITVTVPRELKPRHGVIIKEAE